MSLYESRPEQDFQICIVILSLAVYLNWEWWRKGGKNKQITLYYIQQPEKASSSINTRMRKNLRMEKEWFLKPSGLYSASNLHSREPNVCFKGVFWMVMYP